MRSGDWRRFQSMVKAATGVTHVTRYIGTSIALTASGITTLPLLQADDEPDYDVGGTFTSTPAECEAGSRITGIDLNLTIVPAAVGDIVQWILWKNPDQVLTASTLDPETLFGNDLTTTNALLRKYTLAYGMFVSMTSKETTRIHVRISRAALKRAGVMGDLDRLTLNFKNSNASTPAGLHGYGRIWHRK